MIVDKIENKLLSKLTNDNIGHIKSNIVRVRLSKIVQIGQTVIINNGAE